MRSAGEVGADDRTARARIRDAAIGCFAADGVEATSVRAIATAAGVSPGLVIHHFGSKEGLRHACDEHVTAVIRANKRAAMTAGPAFDPVSALRGAAQTVPLTRYLARTLVDGTPQVAELIDELVHDAVGYMAAGVEAGMLRPSAYPYERAALLMIWSLGALVLHEHLERLIGVDLTRDPSELADRATGGAYIAPALELFAEGLLTDAAAASTRAALAGGDATADTAEETP